MIQINKIDAFKQVIKAIDQGQLEVASQIMKILSNLIKQEKTKLNFSNTFEITNEEYEKFFKNLIIIEENKIIIDENE